jgi:DNA mismatch repair protein MutS2
MNARTLKVLEFEKILERVAAYCAFSGGAEAARSLLPSDDLETVRARLAETAEAFTLLEQKTDISFGGVRDVRSYLERAERGAVLLASDLLEIRNTLLRARSLKNMLTRLERSFPHLAEIAANIQPCGHVIEEIGRCVNDRGEVVDSASDVLAQIRQELRAAQERLLSTLDRLLQNADIKPYLQEALITQRQGRYVIPVRSEYKGNVNGIVHDQSSSGATLFVEPLTVVQQNNSVRELELQEEREVRRILTELSQLVGEEAVYVHRNHHILAELDFTFAKAKYAYALDATVPEVTPFEKPRGLTGGSAAGGEDGDDEPEAVHPGSVMDLRRARHPLLDSKTVVPIDVYLDEDTYIIVITGPNTGGKTVSLKTVGLLTLMAQAGLMIPAEPNSRLSVFDGVYADIGDEQSIEQNLSTFSSHMTHIIEVLTEADPQSLVLLDELGAGTDPDEGSALAMALLENLRDRGITTFATTHYSDLKLYAHNTPGVRNASVEFDVETLSPTFELSIGLPGRSNALVIAKRLGLNPVIVEKAETIVRPDSLQADALLDDIKQARQEAHRTIEQAHERERAAQLMETDLRYQLASIEEARRSVIAEVRSLMQQELEKARREIDQFRRQMARANQFGGAGTHEDFLARADKELAQRQQDTEEVNLAVVMAGPVEERLTGPIEVGDRVWVANLQASGEVLSVSERAGEADVQIGNFRLKLPMKRLELRQKAVKEEQPAGVQFASRRVHDSPGMELDMRGERVEEGLEKIDRYLESAYLARLPWVRIIHGKGTGALRDAVRNMLRQHPLVSEYRAGDMGEGGDGVTVVKLVDNG